MNRSLGFVGALLMVLSCEAAERVFNFTTNTVGKPPEGFRAFVVGQGPAPDWQIVQAEVPSQFAPLIQDRPATYRMPVLAQLFDAPDADVAAAGFHLALADALALALIGAARSRHTRTAVLGGGCFFNRILRDRVVRRLVAAGLTVYLPGPPGCGDAGLAIGQAWVAVQQLQTSHTQVPVEETVPCA